MNLDKKKLLIQIQEQEKIMIESTMKREMYNGRIKTAMNKYINLKDQLRKLETEQLKELWEDKK